MQIILYDGTKEKNSIANFTNYSMYIIALKFAWNGTYESSKIKFHEDRILLTAISSAS